MIECDRTSPGREVDAHVLASGKDAYQCKSNDEAFELTSVGEEHLGRSNVVTCMASTSVNDVL
jgi:hypothetical protein